MTMAIIHDWHVPGARVCEPGAGEVHVRVEPLWRTEEGGGLSIRFVDQRGKLLSIALTPDETDRLSEFLWTRP